MTKDILEGGNAGKWPYRYGDPRDRFSLTLGSDPYAHLRDPWYLPPRDRCEWSPEIARKRTREMDRCRQLFVTIDAAIARGESLREARALYRAQRRQALTAIIGGLLVLILAVVAAAM